MNRNSSKHRRQGASLIELMVVVSLLTAVMAFVGRMLYGLIHAEQASTRDLLLDRRLADLAIQFREDVHRAESVAVSDDGTTLDCTGPAAHRLTYRAAIDSVDRTETGVERSAPPHETYRLPGSRPIFRSRGDGVELVVAHPMPQVQFTPSAPTTGGTVVLRAAPRRYSPSDGKE